MLRRAGIAQAIVNDPQLVALLLLGAGITAITRFGARDSQPTPT